MVKKYMVTDGGHRVPHEVLFEGNTRDGHGVRLVRMCNPVIGTRYAVYVEVMTAPTFWRYEGSSARLSDETSILGNITRGNYKKLRDDGKCSYTYVREAEVARMEKSLKKRR